MNRVFHQSRVSICPECRRLLAADYVESEKGLFLEKRCPEHGRLSTRVSHNFGWLSSQQSFAAKSFEPLVRQTKAEQGCPWDCGECPEHRQKAAFFLFEITDSCDLNCPICLGDPRPNGSFVSLKEFEAMVAAVLAYAGPGQICTLGGGEPTLHPEFFELVRILKSQGFPDIWVYTNGRRIARDHNFAEQLATEQLYVVLQWDSFDDEVYQLLRGQPLLKEKRQALAHLKSSGVRLGLCTTAVAGVNDGELGRIYLTFLEDRAISTLDIATMAYVGKGERWELGREDRITSQDVIMDLENQTSGRVAMSDFSPVSFSHPECLQIAYHLAEPNGDFIPLKRFLEAHDWKALIEDKPLLTIDAKMEGLFKEVVDKLWAGETEDALRQRGLAALRYLIETLFPSSGALSPEEMKTRSTDLVKVALIHSYMDGLNFDVGRSKMCISRTVLPDGRLVPTCAYNVVHRNRN